MRPSQLTQIYLQPRELLKQTVDLRPLLPKNLAGYSITFSVDQRLLEVFVVSPERRPNDFPIVGPSRFNDAKVYQIFPVSDLPKRLK